MHSPGSISHDTASLERHIALHPGSPLFARLAARHITDNRPALALKLCLQGMRLYPEYPTALLLIAKAQVMLRQYSDARETLNELLRSLPGCPAAVQLLDRMTELELEYPPYTASGGNFVAGFDLQRGGASDGERKWSHQEDILPSCGAPKHDGEEPLPEPQAVEQEPAAPTGFDLAALAARLESARIPALPDDEDVMEGAAEEEPLQDAVDLGARPVTETLIDIYEQQGRYREAIDAWHRLAERHPDRVDEFEARIRELENKLDES